MDYYLISRKLITVQYILKATCYTPLTHLKANTITTPPSATIRYDVDNNDDVVNGNDVEDFRDDHGLLAIMHDHEFDVL